MEKKMWTKPLAVAEKFTVNEYIAACGETNTVYKFTCAAPGGTLYADLNGDGRFSWGEELGNYHPCQKYHESPVSDTYYDGFVDYNKNGKKDEGEAVKVWVEFGRVGNVKDAHANANLDMSTWETTKS